MREAAAIRRLLTETFTEQREWELVLLDFWRRAVADDEVRPQFLAHRRALRAAIAESIEQVLGRSPAVGGLSVDEVVTVVLALFNGLAIEQYKLTPTSSRTICSGRCCRCWPAWAEPSWPLSPRGWKGDQLARKDAQRSRWQVTEHCSWDGEGNKGVEGRIRTTARRGSP